MRPTVSDLLRTHGTALIGREEELARARAILGAEDGPVALHVQGPGGVGKSAYLHEVERVARDLDRPTRWVDATDVAGPHELLATLGAEEPAHLGETLAPRTVVLVDHLEALALSEQWFWRDFAPALPADCTLVVGSRRPPQHLDPRLEQLVEVLPLRNLPTEAAMHLLRAHGIPKSVEVTQLVADTYGHPLALVIAADAWSALEKGPEVADSATLLHHPDPAARLLGRFVDDVDDPARRDALHVAAHVRRLDRAILRHALGVDSVVADELLAWLRERPYAKAHRDGLGLHDVVRDALDGDLRWRDPDGYEAMHVTIRAILTRRLREGEGPARDRAAHDLLYLHRGNPATQELYDYRAMGTGTARPAVAADRAVVVDVLTRVEGPVRAGRVGRLIDDDPGAVNVLEDGGGGLLGVLVSARVDDSLQRAADPLASAAWDLICARRPPEPGECVLQYAVADADHPRNVPSSPTSSRRTPC